MPSFALPTTRDEFLALYKTAVASLLLASSASLLLYGVTICWLGRYWTNYKKDHWLLRSGVAAAFVADSVSTLATFLALYRFAVSHSDNPLVIIERIWNWPAIAFSTSFSGLITHAYLAVRLHRLVQKPWLTAALAFMILASFGGGMYLAKALTEYSIAILPALPQFQDLLIVWAAFVMSCHLLLCFTMVIHLRKLSKSQYLHTKQAMQRLTRLALFTETASVALVLALIVTYYVAPIYALPLFLMVGRLYTLTMLLKLNVRRVHTDNESGKGDLSLGLVKDVREAATCELCNVALPLPERVYSGRSEISTYGDDVQAKTTVPNGSQRDNTEPAMTLFDALQQCPTKGPRKGRGTVSAVRPLFVRER